MLFAKGCCKWWKNVAKRIATLEFDRTRKSIGVIVKASSGSNTLLVKVSFPYFLHMCLMIFHVQVYPFSKFHFHWITCLLNWYSECLYSWQGAVETLLEHRSVLWVLLFGDLSWRRHVLYVPSPAWNMSPAQWTGLLLVLVHSASSSSLVIPSTSDDANSCFAFNRQDERDGQEATKVSCEYIGLCFQ
jgi:hypothetical protein